QRTANGSPIAIESDVGNDAADFLVGDRTGGWIVDGQLGKIRQRVQGGVRVPEDQGAVQPVGAALGDHVDLGAGEVPERCVVRRSGNLDLLQNFGRWDDTGGAASLHARHAVDGLDA